MNVLINKVPQVPVDEFAALVQVDPITFKDVETHVIDDVVYGDVIQMKELAGLYKVADVASQLGTIAQVINSLYKNGKIAGLTINGLRHVNLEEVRKVLQDKLATTEARLDKQRQSLNLGKAIDEALKVAVKQTA